MYMYDPWAGTKGVWKRGRRGDARRRGIKGGNGITVIA